MKRKFKMSLNSDEPPKKKIKICRYDNTKKIETYKRILEQNRLITFKKNSQNKPMDRVLLLKNDIIKAKSKPLNQICNKVETYKSILLQNNLVKLKRNEEFMCIKNNYYTTDGIKINKKNGVTSTIWLSNTIRNYVLLILKFYKLEKWT